MSGEPSAESQTQPALEVNLELWQQRLDRLEAEMGSLAGTNQMPDWYANEADGQRLAQIEPQLKKEGVDLAYVSRYVALEKRKGELKSAIYSGFKGYTDNLLGRVMRGLGEELVANAFTAEPDDGPLHHVVTYELEDIVEHRTGAPSTDCLSLLKAAYGFETNAELLSIHGSEYDEKIRALLLTDHAMDKLFFLDRKSGEEKPYAEQLSDWDIGALAFATGLPIEEAADYGFSATKNHAMKLTGTRDAILSVVQKFDHFGHDRIKNITDFTGIYGLEAYTVEQLERMEQLTNSPEEVASQLADHDVTAVLTNRFGDHNAVFRNNASLYDDEANRTLFFEISSLSDIYRHMTALHRLGIQPSTLVLAAHSSAGQFSVTDERPGKPKRTDFAVIAGRKLVAQVNAKDDLVPGFRGYSMHGMKGFARMVEDYMRSSRAIDDTDHDKGRKKIIFEACDAGTEVDMDDLDESGVGVQIGTESVISQLGKDLVVSGIKGPVDIYGGADGMQTHRTATGIYYSSQPEVGTNDRTPMVAERVRVEHGRISKQQVDEVTLRKVA